MGKRACFVLATWCFSIAAVQAAEAEGLRIAVFDQQATGGQGASVEGLLRGLAAQGYLAEAITDLDLLTLADHDVVYLCDMHHPGKVHKEWRKSLQTFVANGGSMLQTWHHHIFGEVGQGVRRVYGSRRMHVEPGHPAVAGIPDFDAMFRDHIVEKVGRLSTVLVRDEAGEPVAVAGCVGKGKVISTGLALAISNGRTSVPPRGPEKRLLERFLAWLEPDIPRAVRSAELLKEPRLIVSPSEQIVASGLEATFRGRVGLARANDLKIECSGARILPDPGVEAEPTDRPAIHGFLVKIPTRPGERGTREFTLHAQVNGRRLKRSFRVEAIAAEPPKDEVRGVWLHVGLDRHPKLVMPELKKLGVNMAVLRIAGGTTAFYASQVQPDVRDPLAPDGDWLAEAVEQAHANGIEIHPYLNNCVVEGRASKESLGRLRAAGRLQEGPDGRPIDWFCPSQDENFDTIERPMIEIVTRYPVDGIQYDFIRYPNASGCFCEKCRKRFENDAGGRVVNWPEDCITGPRREQWIEYRSSRISALVERISTRIRRVAPNVKISAAVFGDWPQCREAVGQDWVKWCQQGWLDFVCPMNYTLDAGLFAARAEIHRDALPEGFPVVQGIGIASGNGKMHRPEELAVQIAIARRYGAAGFVGFCYQPGHTTSLFEPLARWLEVPTPADDP